MKKTNEKKQNKNFFEKIQNLSKTKKYVALTIISLILLFTLIGTIFMVGEAFISPSVTKIDTYCKSQLGIETMSATTSTLAQIGSKKYFEDYDNFDKLESAIQITKTYGADEFVGGVFFFDSMATAIDAGKYLQAKYPSGQFEGKDVVGRVRGNALFVGEKEILKIYNSIIF